MTYQPPNPLAHAEREIAIARKLVGDELTIEPFIPHIMVLVGAFMESGQSGGSAPHTIGAIIGTLERLMMFQPLTELTGDESEWFRHDYPDNPERLAQNIRDPRVFRQPDGTITFNEGLTWVTDGGAYHGAASGVTSRTVITLPCTPKTRYVKVHEFNETLDHHRFEIADPVELRELQASQGILPDIMEP